MKKLKNKKMIGVVFGIVILVIGIISFSSNKIAFAQGNLISEFIHPTEAFAKDEAIKIEVEVSVKYLFGDEKTFKEEKIKAETGQLLDSGDLPVLPDDMKFVDDFIFYEVKGDGKDEIIRKVEKISKEDNGNQANKKILKEIKTKNKKTQSELTKDDIFKMEKESNNLQEKVDKLNMDLQNKEKLNDRQKEEIRALEEEIESLDKKLKKDKDRVDSFRENTELKKSITSLEKNVKSLQDKINETNKSNISQVSTQSLPKKSTNGMLKDSKLDNLVSGKDEAKKDKENIQSSISGSLENKEDKGSEKNEKEIRYPNKLTPKTPANNNNQGTSIDSTSKSVNVNKGVASFPFKARASVIENKDNANKEYPIHHDEDKDNKEINKYSADARQFITFQTKNGKTFHLIINHDEQSENVMLLTEVSEDDLLNMIESKEKPKEVVKEETVKEETVTKKEEEKNNLGTYIILVLVVVGALAVGYYFKVMRKNENEELENFEEEDDFFAEESANEEDDYFEN